MLNGSFHKLFSKRELDEIKGVGKRNHYILVAILAGTFAAITIADGGLDYLRAKMSDPFVQNLEVIIPYEVSKKGDTYKFYLNQDSLKSRFRYDTVMSHVELSLKFWSEKNEAYTRVKGRSIENKNPIFEQVLGRSNLVRGRGFDDEFDAGLIVTKKLLSNLGYSDDTHFIQMAIPRESGDEFKAPVPVIAIVEELPGLASFAFSPYFYKVRNLGGYVNPYSLDNYNDINLFVASDDNDEIDEIRENLREIVETNEALKDLEPDIELYGNSESYIDGKVFNIYFYPEPDSFEELELLYNELINDPAYAKIKKDLVRCYNYDLPMFPEGTISYDRMSILFTSLKKVREFKDYLFNNMELEVEMSKIKDKENFVAISILTVTMAFMLLTFSVFSVALFIYNLLRNHLMKIRMNLGTFKAFGLSNREIQMIYRKIVRRFCLTGIAISFASIFVLDLLIVILFMQELSVLHIFNLYSLITITAILISVEWTVKKTSDSLLENTPGDLIYGRDNN